MLLKVNGMSAHIVEDTLAINNTRKLITALARPLAEIAKNHVVNMKVIQERIEEIETLKLTGRSLNEILYQEQTVLETIKLPQPRTVCTSPQCVTYVKINEYQTESIPNIICHDPCYLTKVPEQCLNNPELSRCQAFIEGMCQMCGCSWQKHMHISHEIKHVKEKVMDCNMKYRLEYSTDRKKEEEKLLKEEKEKLKQMEREHDTIRNSCAVFSSFVTTNSIKQTSDPYNDYLSYLIEDELNKLDNGGSNAFMSISLCDMLDYYKNRLGFITEEIKAGRRSALTTSELKKQIDNLSRLKICGPTIAQLKDLHLQEVTTASVHSTEEAAPSSSVSSNKKLKNNDDVANIRTTKGNRDDVQNIDNRLKDLRMDNTRSSNSLFESDASRF